MDALPNTLGLTP